MWLILRLCGFTHDWRKVIDLTVTPWREAASCLEVTDDVTFFPDKDDIRGIGKAKAVCSTCPVADECLSWAIESNQTEGIWGGHTSRERRMIRRRWLEEIRKAS
jgi:WhiB family redox-sensing transcriptional regulator